MNKKLKINKSFVLFFTATAVSFFILSIFVANRDLSVGSDTLSYALIFYDFIHGTVGGHEPGIYLLVAITSFFSSQHQLFFWLVYLIVSFSLAGTIYNLYIVDKEKSEQFLSFLVFIGFLLLSNWYFSSVVNGLRQGISLGLLYLSISFYTRDKKFVFVFIYLASISFHLSSIILLPFIFLFRWLRLEKQILFIFIALAIGYIVGINEIIIKSISSLAGLSIYNNIKFYAAENASGLAPWSGFQLDLFIYTAFWYVFPFFINYYFNWFDNRESVFQVLNIYAILSMPYFVFGFGGFSNRYAFIAWLFLPILQSIIFMRLRLRVKYKLFFALLLSGVGVIYFLEWFV